MVKIKTHKELLSSGWDYVPVLNIYEHSFDMWKDGTPLILTDEMKRIVEWFSEDDKDAIESFLNSDQKEIRYGGVWWHVSMFEGQYKKYGCDHDWVNVSFIHLRFVCKKCNLEKD